MPNLAKDETDPSIIGRIADAIRQVEQDIQEDLAAGQKGCGITLIFPDGTYTGDLVIRFSDGVTLAALSPAVADLVSALSPGDTVECDFPDGTIFIGFSHTPWDTPDRFQEVLDLAVSESLANTPANEPSYTSPSAVPIIPTQPTATGSWRSRLMALLKSSG